MCTPCFIICMTFIKNTIARCYQRFYDRSLPRCWSSDIFLLPITKIPFFAFISGPKQYILFIVFFPTNIVSVLLTLLMSNVDRDSHLWCMVIYLWCMAICLWYMVICLLYISIYLWCMVIYLWYMAIYGVWSSVFGIWPSVYGIWCAFLARASLKATKAQLVPEVR